MSANNYWLKNGIIILLQNFGGVVFGTLSFYFLVRVLSKDDYGVWVIFLSIVNIVELAKNGLTQEATIKYLSSANKADKLRITTASFFISIVVTLFLSLVIIIFAPFFAKLWHSEELPQMLYVSIFMYLAGGILAQINYSEQSNLSFRGNFYSFLSRQIVFFLYVAISFFLSLKITLTSLAAVQAFSVIVAIIVAYLMSKKYVKFTKKIDFLWVKKLFHFGKYSFGTGLTTVLSSSIDQMMLGNMLSKSASGSFNVAVRITNLADIPVSAMASVAFPQSARRIEKEGDAAVKYLFEKTVGVTLSILLPIILGINIFAELVTHIIAGHKYDDAIPLLRIILVACIFYPYGRQTGTMLVASGKVKINFYLMLINTFTITVSNYFLITHFGMIGAAYATLLSVLIGVLISQIVLFRFFKVNFLNTWIYAFRFYPEFYNTHVKKVKNDN